LRQDTVENEQSDATSDALLTMNNQVTRCEFCKEEDIMLRTVRPRDEKKKKMSSRIATTIGLAALLREAIKRKKMHLWRLVAREIL
jgi:hypothetical protein